MASCDTGMPMVPASPYGSVSCPMIHPPHPDTYMFSQRSTRKATGEILGSLLLGLPKVVEKIKPDRSFFSLDTNCLAPWLINWTLDVVGHVPLVVPIIYGNPPLS